MTRVDQPDADAPALSLRPWAVTDAGALREAIDEDVDHLRPWLSWTLEEPASLERTRLRIAMHMEEHASGVAWRYAIIALDTPSRIIGGAGLNRRIGPAAYEVGYWVRKSAARRGIARAAVAALVVQAFDRLGAERLVIRCDVTNHASAAFARNLGFAFAGEHERTYPDGSPRPVLQFEMLREDFRRRHAALRDLGRHVDLDPGLDTRPGPEPGEPASGPSAAFPVPSQMRHP